MRRISEHLRVQNWVAVVLDLLIVIVGIFIGLQVSDWNAARQDVRREAEILDRLRAEFGEIRSEVDAAIAEHVRQIDGLVAVMQSVEAGAVAAGDEDRFRFGLRSALWFDPGARRSATWLDVVSSGQTALLRDAELRSALSRYDELHQSARPLFAQFWEGQRLHEVAFGRHFDYEVGRPQVDGIYLGGDVADYDIDTMSRDPEFLRAVQRLTEYQSYYQFWHVKMGRAADEVLALLPDQAGN